MGGGQEKKAGRENGIIESGYLAVRIQKLAYFHLSLQLLLSDFPSEPMVTAGLFVLKRSHPKQSILKKWMQSVCAYIDAYIYSQNTFIHGYF